MKNTTTDTLRQKWASIPGVAFPKTETSATQSLKNCPKGYASTADLAERYGTSISYTRKILHAKDVPHVRVAKTLYWCTRSADAYFQDRGIRLSAPPTGWLTCADACAKAGISRGLLERLFALGKLRKSTAYLSRKDGKAYKMNLCHKTDLETFMHERATKQQAEAAHRAEMLAFKQSRRK